MAKELRTLHKMETSQVMEMVEKSLRLTTEHRLGYSFISDEHIIEFPLFHSLLECGEVSGIRNATCDVNHTETR